MRSHERRLKELEKKATATDNAKGNSLQEIYQWEDSPGGKKALDLLYAEPKDKDQ